MVCKGVGVQIYTIMCFIRGVRIEGRLESWQVVTRLEGFSDCSTWNKVNGVNRGGAYDNTNHAQYTRICYIQPRERRGLAMWVGFRTE